MAGMEEIGQAIYLIILPALILSVCEDIAVGKVRNSFLALAMACVKFVTPKLFSSKS